MNKKTILYSTPICPYCVTLKKFLKDENVEFEEVDVSQDEKLQDMIIEKTGKMSVPVIVIDNEWIAGFDREKISSLLDLN